MKTYKVLSYGKEYEVVPKISKYAHGGLAVVMDYWDDEYGYWGPYASLTVNLGGRLNHGFAYVDTNNCPWAKKFIEENGLGKFTGKTCRSGWCEYPLYEFDIKKMEVA